MLGCVQRLAASLKLCAFISPDLNVFLRGGYLLFIDLRSHVYGFIKAVADLELLRAIDEPVRELPVYAFLHDYAACGGAALPRSAECTPQDAIESQVEIGVVQHNDRVFSAHLERAGFKAAGGGFTHQPPDFAGACK